MLNFLSPPILQSLGTLSPYSQVSIPASNINSFLMEDTFKQVNCCHSNLSLSYLPPPALSFWLNVSPSSHRTMTAWT